MWLSSDGRVHTIAIPTASIPQGVELVEAIEGLTPAELELVEQRIQEIEWATADEVVTVHYSAEERVYENQVPPLELLRSNVNEVAHWQGTDTSSGVVIGAGAGCSGSIGYSVQFG
jgi:hypothetical protein